MKQWKKRLLALILTAVTLTGTGRAESFWEWIFGEPEDAPVAAEATLPDDGVILPELTLAPTEAPLPELTLSPAGTAATDFAECALEDDGMLRVYLRSLDAPQALHLTLAGAYAVEGDRGFRFERGTAVTLYLEDGEVWLSSGGLVIDMGLGLTLTRHAIAEGENGLYIEESEKPTLYCGDLSVTASGYGLRPVLRVQVEEYLRGVVAYEMSDSFPLEALKAQAVAARTYALQRKWGAGRRDYDVVDTTADQVFKGYDPEYQNVVTAVEETRGLVGMYKGGFATCYYTASNGGQTALPSQIWGGSPDEGYLAMADDPSDLENPKSLQSDLSFTAECEGSIKLRKMLVSALAPVMEAAGFDKDAWAFDRIAAIEPVNPRFEGSRMYDGLAFDLRVRVAESALQTPSPIPEETASAEPSETPAATEAAMAVAPESEPWALHPDTFRVVLDVYDDIKDGLAMGLNGSDCELISVETEAGPDGEPAAFKLVMRRFGHGVGMSQRGAQWMAGHYDKTFSEILAFYYPGMSVERMRWPDTAPESLSDADAVGASRPRPTPTPSPAPLPALQSGERYASVNATTLNVREQPTTSARILDMLERGQRLIVSGDPDGDGWVPVHTGEVEGFVKAEYLD